MTHLFPRTLPALAALLLAVAPAAAQKKSDSVVKIDATLTKPDDNGNQTITITIDIDKNWHLYANPVGNDLLAPVQTTVKVLSKVDDVKITYPEGKLIKDSTVGDYKVYEGKATITAKVKRGKGDTGPLEYSVSLQACNDKTCLLKAVVKKTVP